MVKKTPIQGSDKVSVTFEVTPEHAARSVCVAGDFNDWDSRALPMKQRKDGTWAATIRLPKARTYQYRFVVNGDQWISDDQADAQAPNVHGSHNSVLDLR